jgi:hypothetical protein
MEQLKEHEKIMMQVIVTPAKRKHLPIYREAKTERSDVRSLFKGTMASRDEVKEQRDKLSEPNMMVTLRVAATANTDSAAEHLIFKVQTILASTGTASTKFVRKQTFLSLENMQRRVDDALHWTFMPIQLTVSELAALIAWPIGEHQTSGRSRPLGRIFPVPGSVRGDEIVVGKSAMHGSERRVSIGYNEALMHTYIAGGTGTGKTELLGHVARQIMEQGYGLIVMETEGNLYQKVLDYAPRNRIDDFILLDLADHHPVAFNVLDQGAQATVVDDIINLFAHRYGTGVWSDEYILNGMKTLAEVPGTTLMDLGPFLAPTDDEVDWANEIASKVKDVELKRWLQRHEHRGKVEQQKRADPVLSRLSQMASRPELRYVFGQEKSAFQIRDVIEQNKILLVSLKGVSPATASLAGTLIMNALWPAVKSTKAPKPNYLILDEFADFMDLPIDTESMLAQARKHNFGMFLANQHTGQLKPAVRSAVLTNARNKGFFAGNAEDGQALARALSDEIDAHDVTSLQKYEAIFSVLTDTGDSGPLSIVTLPSAPSTGIAHKVIAASRQRYGTPESVVRRDMLERRRPAEHPKQHRRPKISGEGWGKPQAASEGA